MTASRPGDFWGAWELSEVEDIVAKRTAAEVGGVFVDTFTASAVVAVLSACSAETVARLREVPFEAVARKALELAARGRA